MTSDVKKIMVSGVEFIVQPQLCEEDNAIYISSLPKEEKEKIHDVCRTG